MIYRVASNKSTVHQLSIISKSGSIPRINPHSFRNIPTEIVCQNYTVTTIPGADPMLQKFACNKMNISGKVSSLGLNIWKVKVAQ